MDEYLSMATPNGSELIDPDKYLESVAKLADVFTKLDKELSNTSPTFEKAKSFHENVIDIYKNEIDFVIMQFQSFLDDVKINIDTYIVIGEEPAVEEIENIDIAQTEFFLLRRSVSVLSQTLKQYLEDIVHAEAPEDLNLHDVLLSMDELTVRLTNVSRDFPDALSNESTYFSTVLIRVLENPTITSDTPGL